MIRWRKQQKGRPKFGAGRAVMPESRPLNGQSAIVTGGSRGIGLAIAERLGRMGARVAISGRSRASLEAARKRLHSMDIAALAVVADVRSSESVESFAQKVQDEFGDLHILVNNAGIGVFGPAHEAREEDWDAVLDTNLKGVWLMTRAVAPQMIRRGGGHVINISSLAGKNTFANGGIYCASKWGLQGLSACMAEDLRAHGIRVSLICPGSVHTEFSPHAGKDPLKMLQPGDVAHAVALLVTQAPQSFISEIQMRPTQKP
jgi:NAD(P)-dependent dehydrogenase (short-subunit alcohol dehydrogenase family)